MRSKRRGAGPDGVPPPGRLRDTLVSRLLLAAAPVGLVIVLLMAVIVAPLFRTPYILARAERGLTEALQMHELVELLAEQPKHWSEYGYLPADGRAAVRREIADADNRIVLLRRRWDDPPAAVRSAFSTYATLSKRAGASLAAVDAGRAGEAQLVLVGLLRPAARLIDDVEGQLFDGTEALSGNMSRLAGSLRFSRLNGGLGARISTTDREVQNAVRLAGIQALVVRQAGEYAQLIATGDRAHRLQLEGLSTLVRRELDRHTSVIKQQGFLDELPAVDRIRHDLEVMSAKGEAVLALVDTGQQELAARSFERDVHRFLDLTVLPAIRGATQLERREATEAFADVAGHAVRLRSVVAVAGMVALAMLALPVIFIARSTVRPLRRIQRAASNVGAGDLSARSGVDETSEVGELARAFDAMAEQLEHSRGALLSAAVVETSSDLILIVKDGRATYASRASQSLLGRRPEELYRMDLVSLLHPDDIPAMRAWLGDNPANGAAIELRLAAGDGWVDTEVAITDLRDHPQVGGLVFSVRDMTDRKQAGLALEAARDAALDASRMKSEFLTTMSHEIRTPMNGVIGLTGLLLGTGLDERQRQYAEGVRGAGEALLAIINDILDFSKIEAGRLELEEIDFDLVQVVEEATGLVVEAARLKGLELVAYCAPDLPVLVRGDPSRIRQVLLNLASNAVKFTETGEVVIGAHLAEQTGEGVVVRFEVVDTGIGIAPADRQRLFQPFSQADVSTTRRYGGTGLGLAISRQLVAAMEGELGVTSEVGRGSTFWFTLPLGRAAEGAVGPARSTHLLDGLRVLVVDDNDTNRLILHEQLASWDLRPEGVESGPAALERLHEAVRAGQDYDLVLLDMCMPDMDGLDLARRISSDPALAGTRLVLLTSGPDVGAEEALEAGIAAQLTKPVRQSQLYDALMRVTAPTQREAPAPPPPSVARAPGSRGRVLVVEDNAINQMVALGILEQLGYSADVAANGLEALDALARTAYSAVLMDCQMPEMDGYTATTEIRRREGAARHTPIIAMTAAAVEVDRERCLAAGMDDYIAKPVKPDSVDAALALWAIENPGAPSLPTPPAARPTDTPTASEVVDHHRLEVLRRIGPVDGALLRSMVDAFVGELPANLTSLHDAVRDADSSAVRRRAHRLRGAAGNLGATILAALCGQLEELGHAGQLDGAPALLGELETAAERAASALRAAGTPGS